MNTRCLIALTAIALAASTVEAKGSFRTKSAPTYHTYTVGGNQKSGLQTWRAGSQNKLFGGIKNLISAPVEIPAAMNRGYQSKGVGGAMFSGLTQGLTNMVRRAGAGAADVVTFPTKYPNGSYRTTMPAKGPIQVYQGSRKR